MTRSSIPRGSSKLRDYIWLSTDHAYIETWSWSIRHATIPSRLQSALCALSRTSRPLSVRSGLPPFPVTCSKKTGFQVSFFCSRWRAFSRCASSSSCFKVVALENCFDKIALVTPPHSFKDSFGSCWSSGGSDLGATLRGAISIMVVRASWGWES